MRKIIFLIGSLWLISLNCFGQDPYMPQSKGETPPTVPSSSLEKKIIKPPVKPLEIKGTIETITIAEPSKGIRPELSILGMDGKHYLFLVRSTTTIYGLDWKPVTLDELVHGQNVRIQYIIHKDGMLVALSIKPVM